MKAMIFAAGLGTRLKPLTDRIPKALVPVSGKPLLEHLIIKLKSAGVSEIIVNVHHFADQIIDFLKEKNYFDIRIEVSDERDLLLNTGGGLKKTAHFFDDGNPFIVYNVDILSNINLKELYQNHLEEKGRLATLAISKRDTFRYLLFDKKNHLKGWVNTKTGETKPISQLNIAEFQQYAFAGIQIVSPEIFKLMETEPAVFPIMDFYLKNCRRENIAGYVDESLKILDVGKVETLAIADEFNIDL